MDEAMLQETLKGYLHGELTETEQQKLEERLLADPECLEQLLELRDDWLDGAARCELSAVEQAALERQLNRLPTLRARLAFAETLLAQAARRVEPRALRKVLPPGLRPSVNGVGSFRRRRSRSC